MQFQIYSGCNVVAAGNGPRYVTLTFWTVPPNVACDGFESDTIFLPGIYGALSQYSIVVGHVVNGGPAISVAIYNPETAGWASTDEMAEKNVIFTGRRLRVKVELSGPIASVGAFPCPVEIRAFNLNSDPDTWLPIALNADDTLGPGGCELRVIVTYPELQQLGVLPATVTDGLPESSSADKNAELNGFSNRRDSDTFDRATSQLYHFRGRCRGDGDLNALSIPEFPFSTQFLQSAGVRLIQVRVKGVKSSVRQVQNQADWFYISAHGSPVTGRVFNDSVTGSLSPSQARWNEDLDTVFIAGCSVLDINDYNNNYPGPQHTASPGKQWIATGPSVFVGYNFTAPLDGFHGDDDYTRHIIGRFLAYYNYGGASSFNYVTAWRDANRLRTTVTTDNTSPFGRPYNACLIDLRPDGEANDVYWYFDYGGGLGPVWTPVLRANW